MVDSSDVEVLMSWCLERERGEKGGGENHSRGRVGPPEGAGCGESLLAEAARLRREVAQREDGGWEHVRVPLTAVAKEHQGAEGQACSV